MTFGLYLDQIVRRVDEKHRSLSEYFKEEIAEPFSKCKLFVYTCICFGISTMQKVRDSEG